MQPQKKKKPLIQGDRGKKDPRESLKLVRKAAVMVAREPKESVVIDCIKDCSETRHKPSAFFKIMINEFKKFLYIPPKYASTMKGLFGQTVFLRDLNGQSWRVRLSTEKCGLAFREGWDDFVQDHCISLGELVMFEYLDHSVFQVRIFGKDAWERVIFDEQEKTTSDFGSKRKTRGLPDKNIHGSKRQKISKHKREATPSTSNSSMIVGHAVDGATRQEPRAIAAVPLLRVPCLPKPKLPCLPKCHPPKQKCYTSDACDLVGWCECAKRYLLTEDGVVHIVDENLTDKIGRNMLTANEKVAKEKKDIVHHKGEGAILRKPPLQHVNSSDALCGKPIIDLTVFEGGRHRPTAKKISRMPYGEGRVSEAPAEKIRKEIIPSMKGKTVKDKPKGLEKKNHIPRTLATLRVSLCLTTDPSSLLALPGDLRSQFGRMSRPRRVITLCDLSSRLWPVLYQEDCSFIGFISGWQHFARANKLKKGDVCEFEADHGSKFTLHLRRISRA